ncbi:MAG: T9SS type A sorting domain-containing protein [Bacteroidales bacterium]|jgi:hypothetical protein|nr:T9SS type A sorting domain-containing protein [Bacteroidales bacterium]
MKKTVLLLSLLLFISFFAYPQVYQLPNGGFEQWDGNGANDEPTHWNGFPSASCDLSGVAALGCGTATATRHAKSEDKRPGSAGNYSCKIFATRISILGNNITANGNITTGQIRIGSTTATNQENHNITRTSDPNMSQIFTAKPDSIRFWARFECPDVSQEARMSATIHDNYDYRDPSGTDSNAGDHVVAKAILNFNRGNQEWKQYSVPFNYDNPATNARYILLTFTTNKNPGEGSASDFLYIDDVEMVYNTNLRELMVNGNRIDNFNPEITEYHVDVECGSNNIISALAASPNASVNIIQGSSDNQTATVTVNAGNQSKTYTIHFYYRSFSYIDDVICQGESYTENGFDLPVQNTAGIFTYMITLSYSGNCENVLKLTLTVNPAYNSPTPLNIMICENSSYNFFGEILTTEGTYTHTVQTINGCDSTVIINLTTGDRFESTIEASICEGETYNQHGFNESRTGIYEKTYQSLSDCDSVVFLNLKVNPAYNTNIYDTIYSGAYYNQHGFFIIDTDLTGDFEYFQDYEMETGCDSIISLYLHIKQYQQEYPPTNIDFYFEIFPNPTSDHFKIYVEDYLADDLKYTLMNSFGAIISKGEIIGNYFDVDMSACNSGVYILKIYLTDDYYKTTKVVKK